MLYVLLAVAVAMSFFAGLECVLLVEGKKKIRHLNVKNNILANENHVLKWELEREKNHKGVIEEVAE